MKKKPSSKLISQPSSASKPAIFIHELRKTYRSTVALDGISLEIQQGEFFGLLGPNGAGKTTTIHILAGLCNKTSGTVSVFDHDLISDYRAVRLSIGLVPQEFNMDQFEQVYRLLFFNGGYFGLSGKALEQRIKTLLTDLGLWEKRFSKVRELSGGMKRKLMIARALLHDPKLLILDEPTAGVDVETRKTLWNYIQKLNAAGTTILLTTHYIEEAEELCDRIAIINKGKIITCKPKKELIQEFAVDELVIHLKKPLSIIPPQLTLYSPRLSDKGMTLLIALDYQKHSVQTVLQTLFQSNLVIDRFSVTQKKLEDIFLSLTGLSEKLKQSPTVRLPIVLKQRKKDLTKNNS